MTRIWQLGAALMARLDIWPKRSAFLAGAILPLCFAPFFLLPIFYLSYGVFFRLLVRAPDAKIALFLGWLFGFGQFFTGLIWMGEAFLVDAERFIWLLPFAVTLLPTGLALFPALAAGAAFGLGRALNLDALGRALLVALFLSLAAYLRSTMLTGLPWNLPVMGWASWLYLAQPVAFIGMHGLGVVAFISAALLGLGAKRTALIGLALPMMAAFVSVVQLHMRAPASAWLAHDAASHEPLQVVLVQPNIAQADKWHPDKREANIDKTFRLTRLAISQSPEADLIVWPETALPALIDEGTGFGERLASVFRDDAAPLPYLLTGGIRREIKAAGTDFYNSAMLWSGTGDLLARSDKHHLVPFGEYLPLQAFLESLGLEQLTRLQGGYRPGDPHARLSAARLPLIAPLICYEVIFPPLSAGGPRPAFLLNITNDAWFGQSIGPHQHLAQARLRAIEQGLPLLRAANTGISTGFDARGRAMEKLALGETGSLTLFVPPSLPPSFYARWGEAAFVVLLLGVCGFIFYQPLRKELRKRLRKR